MANFSSYFTKRTCDKCCGTCAYWEGERKLQGSSKIIIAAGGNLANCSKRHGNDNGLGKSNCSDWKPRW